MEKVVNRVKLVLAYDGTDFHGFAAQPGVRTIGGELSDSLETMFGDVPEMICAGRTDAGVHAWGQVVHFEVEQALLARYDMNRFARSLNRQLGPEIVVRDAVVVPNDFHARFSATQRIYRYKILLAPNNVPFSRHAHWWIPGSLDTDAMQASCEIILGEHDFSTFCRKPKSEEVVSLVRHIDSAQWTVRECDTGLELQFEIAGNAFCHQMVRSLTGYIVEIGRGNRSLDEFDYALEARDRQFGAPLAPPQGLCLWEVRY